MSLPNAYLNQYYDANRNIDLALGIADLTFSGDLFVTSTLPSPPVVQNLTGNKKPDLWSGAGAVECFLVLRNLTLSANQRRRNLRGNHESQGNSQTVNVPIGGGSQIFQFVNADALTALGFQTFTAATPGLEVNFVNIDRNDGLFQTVFLPNGPIGGIGTTYLLSLTPQFGPYGFESFVTGTGGVRAQIGIINTTGAAQSFVLLMMGSAYKEEDILFNVDYIDPIKAVTALIRNAQISEREAIFPIDLQMPNPISDPGLQNYGQIVLTPIINASAYDALITVSYVLSASLLYLVPGGV